MNERGKVMNKLEDLEHGITGPEDKNITIDEDIAENITVLKCGIYFKEINRKRQSAAALCTDCRSVKRRKCSVEDAQKPVHTNLRYLNPHEVIMSVKQHAVSKKMKSRKSKDSWIK